MDRRVDGSTGADVQRMINYVFEDGPHLNQESPWQWRRQQSSFGSNMGASLLNYVHSLVAEVETHYWHKQTAITASIPPPGRQGPSKVCFAEGDKYKILQHPLGLFAQDNFVSVKANACASQGLWEYEVTIGSSGVVQVGWATDHTEFTAEKGVGDSPHSYSYDGNRQRSWNVQSRKYGEVWQSGDVITSSINIEQRAISYKRNGKDLGVAFKNIATGNNFGYFPAFSLSKGEYIKINFGEMPMQYPTDGYAPLQRAPGVAVSIADACLGWLYRLVQYRRSCQQDACNQKSPQWRWLWAAWTIAAHTVMKLLGPLLTAENTGLYVVISSLGPFLQRLVPLDYLATSAQDGGGEDHPLLQEMRMILQLLHSGLQPSEVLSVLRLVMLLPIAQSRQPSASVDFARHKEGLRLLSALLLHKPTRLLIIDELLFEGSRLSSLLCYSVDDSLLQQLLPSVHWRSEDGRVASGDQQQYEAGLGTLDNAMHEVERLQVFLLLQLLTLEPDEPLQRTSRGRFLHKLRHVLIKNSLSMAKFSQTTLVPLFHSLLQAFGKLWLRELPCHRRHCLPAHLFCDNSIDFLGNNRLGGLFSHLVKMYRQQCQQTVTEARLQAPSQCAFCSSSHSLPLDGQQSWFECFRDASVDDMEVDGPMDCSVTDPSVPLVENSTSRASLYQLADCLLMMYHYCMHRSLMRVGVSKESLNNSFERVADVTERLQTLNALSEMQRSAAVVDELTASLTVMRAECDSLVRSQSRHRVLNFAPRRFASYLNLLQLTFNTVKAASDRGPMLAFIPEYYVDVLSELSLGLADHFKTDSRVTERTTLYSELAKFLCYHFTDERVRFTDSRETLMQMVAAFVTCGDTLKVLEGAPQQSREALVRNLLQPYEKRVWAQNNWILVRFWKGSGFAYRHYLSPHLSTKITPKPTYSDSGIQLIKPGPSKVFQDEVAAFLLKDISASTRFVNSLLMQLNWAFSEFIGMLQEIQNYCNRQERVFIDSRQLRICSTCFDLTVSLLRVLEMVVVLAPQLFLTSTSTVVPGSEGQPEVLLSMLCKLLCHVVNRASVTGRGCFSQIVSLEIPGLDSLHHFPLLAAAAGTLTALLKEDMQGGLTHEAVATKALLSEPSFELCSFETLIASCDENQSMANSSSSLRGDVGIVIDSTMSQTANPEQAENVGLMELDVRDLQPPPTAAAAMLEERRRETAYPLADKLTPFSLRQYPNDVSPAELDLLASCLSYIKEYQSRPSVASPADAFQECVICYARPAVTSFLPCAHSSCRACVTQHLMNHKGCFFCMVPITSLKDEITGVALPIASLIPSGPAAAATDPETAATNTDASAATTDPDTNFDPAYSVTSPEQFFHSDSHGEPVIGSSNNGDEDDLGRNTFLRNGSPQDAHGDDASNVPNSRLEDR